MSNHIESPTDNRVHECSQAQPASLEELVKEIQKLQKEDPKHLVKQVKVHDLPQVQFSEKGLTGKPNNCTDFVENERKVLDFCRKFGPDGILTKDGKQVMQVHEPKRTEEHNIQSAASQTTECTDQRIDATPLRQTSRWKDFQSSKN